jgi:hypothetical protein
MNIRHNIGILNALLRITCGLTILAWSTSKLVRNPWRDSYLFIALMGAMKVAEGIVRYCPLTDLFERYQEKQCENTCDTEAEVFTQTDEVPYNPS